MPRHLAVDLGAWAVKVSVVELVGKKVVVHERASERLPSGPEPASFEDRVAALERLLKAKPGLLRVASTIGAWPTERASLRRLTMPFGDAAQVEKTLGFSIESEVPFDLEDMVLVWRPLARTPAETRLLYGLAQKEDLDERLAAMRRLGVDPRAILVDCEGLAGAAPKEGVHAVIDVGHARTVVACVRDGVLWGARAIDVGGRDFTAAIQAATGSTWEEAEARKHGEVGEGVAVGSHDAWATWPRAVREAVATPFGQLIAEVRSSLIAYEDELGVEFVGARVCGGGARLTRLTSFFEEELGVPVQPVEDASGGPVPLESVLADGLGAVGGLPGLLDLRVGEFSFRGGADLPRAIIVYGSVGFAMLAFMILALGAARYMMLRSQLAEADAAMKQAVVDAIPGLDPSVVRDSLTAKAVMQENLDNMRDRASVLAQGDKPPVTSKLRDLSTAVPPATETVIDATEIVVQPDNLTMTAETDGYASASAIETRLQAFPGFKGATKGPDKKSKDKVSFTITIPLGEGDEKPAGEEG